MDALVYDATADELAVRRVPRPTPRPGEALVRVLRAQICSTDIEITRGYVQGYAGTLGHEFVGVVVTLGAETSGGGDDAAVARAPPPIVQVGTRVVCEINCNDQGFTCADALFTRNHAPGRSVLGIINHDGCAAEYVCVPRRNLHAVPSGVSDAEACFAEPLAAALRIVEQGIVAVVVGDGGGEGGGDDDEHPNAAARRVLAGLCGGKDDRPPPQQQRIAVLGDGKLGLLVAQVLALAAPGSVTLFGRHAEKMALVRGDGLAARVVVEEEDRAAPPPPLDAQFDVVVEATGSARGIRRALALTRPCGTVVLKSTVSAASGEGLAWADVCGTAVVQELTLRGSRCGPMDAAVALLAASEDVRRLVREMVSDEFPLSEGVAAMRRAKEKGVLKVALVPG